MPRADRGAPCIELAINQSRCKISTTLRGQTSKQTNPAEVRIYMPTIMLQPDDNPLRATGSETNFVLQTQDHLLSPLTYEIEILNCPVPIEAAAAGILGDLASGAG